MISKDDERNFLKLLRGIESIESDFPQVNSRKINIFEAAGLVRQEIRHSKVLSYLLKPNENHGLGDLFFKKLITHPAISDTSMYLDNSNCPSALKMAINDFDDLFVRPEDMQIDILMWSSRNKIVVAIENKVGASEGDNQLKRYTDKITEDTRFKGYSRILLYLTPDGDAGSNEEWLSISYKLIIEILENIIENSINIETTLFVNHYIELIRKHIVNEEDEELKSACASLYEKHKNVFDLIYKNIDLGGSVSEAIKNFAKFNSSIVVNASNNNWLSFMPKNLYENMQDIALTRQWHKQNKPLVFFYSFYEDKIKLVLEVGPIKDLDVRNKLVTALFKHLKGIDKSAKSDIYTRVWSKIEKFSSNLDIDDIGADQLLEHMTSLNKEVDTLIPMINSALTETFQLDANQPLLDQIPL